MAAYRIVLLLVALTLTLSPGSVDAVPDRLAELNFRLSPPAILANDMALKDLYGRVFTLSSLRGRVIILNFWKIDCPPCSKEKPILERIFRKYGGRGLEVVAVNLVDSADQQQAYVRNGRFGFRFASAPDTRLCLRQLSTGPGISTSFVVNSKQDAIYEVPAVPTTYLIDRNGCMVGNCVGLADWEQPAMVQLLESVLGPASRTVTMVSESREEVERSGPISFAAAANTGPAKSGATHSGPIAQAMDPTRLPFQGGTRTTASESTLPSAPQPSVEVPGTPVTKPTSATSRSAAQPKAAAKKRLDAKPPAASGVDYRQPRPYAGPSGDIAKPAPGPTRPAVARPATKPQALPPQPILPVTSMAPAQPGPAQAPPASGTLLALPPAMPYNPRATSTAQPQVQPDQDGSVLARIPSSGRSGAAVPGPGGPERTAGTLPPAQPLSERDSITGFVQDSFGRQGAPAAQPQAAPGTAPQAPATSLWGQLGQDFQQLGNGIKDVFSRLTPSR